MFCQFQKKLYLCNRISEEMIVWQARKSSHKYWKDNNCWRGGGIGRRATLRW